MKILLGKKMKMLKKIEIWFNCGDLLEEVKEKTGSSTINWTQKLFYEYEKSYLKLELFSFHQNRLHHLATWFKMKLQVSRLEKQMESHA